MPAGPHPLFPRMASRSEETRRILLHRNAPVHGKFQARVRNPFLAFDVAVWAASRKIHTPGEPLDAPESGHFCPRLPEVSAGSVGHERPAEDISSRTPTCQSPLRESP